MYQFQGQRSHIKSSTIHTRIRGKISEIVRLIGHDFQSDFDQSITNTCQHFQSCIDQYASRSIGLLQESDYRKRLSLPDSQIGDAVDKMSQSLPLAEHMAFIKAQLKNILDDQMIEKIIYDSLFELAISTLPISEFTSHPENKEYGLYKILDVLNDSPSSLSSLRELRLEMYGISRWEKGLILKLFECFSGVRVLGMKSGQLNFLQNHAIVEGLSVFQEVRYLTLKDTPFSLLYPRTISLLMNFFPKLQYLNLEQCGIYDLPLDSISMLSELFGRLRGLNLSTNKLGCMNLEHWRILSKNFATLESLSIGWNGFSHLETNSIGTIFQSFSGVQNLDVTFDNFGALDEHGVRLIIEPLKHAKKLRLNVDPFLEILLRVYPQLKDVIDF